MNFYRDIIIPFSLFILTFISTSLCIQTAFLISPYFFADSAAFLNPSSQVFTSFVDMMTLDGRHLPLVILVNGFWLKISPSPSLYHACLGGSLFVSLTAFFSYYTVVHVIDYMMPRIRNVQLVRGINFSRDNLLLYFFISLNIFLITTLSFLLSVNKMIDYLVLPAFLITLIVFIYFLIQRNEEVKYTNFLLIIMGFLLCVLPLSRLPLVILSMALILIFLIFGCSNIGKIYAIKHLFFGATIGFVVTLLTILFMSNYANPLYVIEIYLKSIFQEQTSAYTIEDLVSYYFIQFSYMLGYILIFVIFICLFIYVKRKYKPIILLSFIVLIIYIASQSYIVFPVLPNFFGHSDKISIIIAAFLLSSIICTLIINRGKSLSSIKFQLLIVSTLSLFLVTLGTGTVYYRFHVLFSIPLIMSIFCLNEILEVKGVETYIHFNSLIPHILLSIILIFSLINYYPTDLNNYKSFTHDSLMGFKASDKQIQIIDPFLNAIDDNCRVSTTMERYGHGSIYYLTNLTPIKKRDLSGFANFIHYGSRTNIANIINETFLNEIPDIFAGFHMNAPLNSDNFYFIVEDFFNNTLKYKLVYSDGENKVFINPTSSVPNKSQKDAMLLFIEEQYKLDGYEKP